MSPTTKARSSVSVRPQRHHGFPRSFDGLLAAAACWLACASSAMAAVEVDFSHTNSAATNPNQNTGDITLAFTVDGSGNVTLDASCANPGPAANVNEFDGPCGTISDTAMWGQTFTITLTSSGSGSLRVSNLTTGLSVQGEQLGTRGCRQRADHRHRHAVSERNSGCWNSHTQMPRPRRAPR